MRYALRKQDKIASVFGDDYLKITSYRALIAFSQTAMMTELSEALIWMLIKPLRVKAMLC